MSFGDRRKRQIKLGVSDRVSAFRYRNVSSFCSHTVCFVSSPAICLLSCILSHNLSTLTVFLSFIIVSLGSCAVRASVKYNSTAALMTAGSSSRAGPGQPQLPISMATLTPQSSGSPAEACRGHPTSYLGSSHYCCSAGGPFRAGSSHF